MKNKLWNNTAFVKKLISFSPRQLEGETKTADFLKDTLNENKVDFKIHSFNVPIPLLKKTELLVDGKSIECDGCSMIGGKINSKYKIISSLVSSAVLQNDPNLNFNPHCSAISNSNYYFAPSLSLTHEGLNKVLKAKEVKGVVEVDKISHKAENILVGNQKNPKYICFAHYDSIKMGAVDNASGVAVMMGVILSKPELLKTTLFVFSANEELSYDKPVYWGHGFRVFEKKYEKLMQSAKKLVVIDSVGNGKTIPITDPSIVRLGFPIANAKKWQKKIHFLAGDFEHLMSVYHSDLDDGRGMSEEWLLDANRELVKLLT